MPSYVALGGEEFVVALPDADLAATCAYTDRVARALRDEHIEQSLRLTASAGIALLTSEVADVDSLLAHADDALYAAKEAGRECAAWWQDGAIAVGARLVGMHDAATPQGERGAVAA